MTGLLQAPPRDLVGYGRNRPNPNWPGGAFVAISFVLNYEEGGEMSVELGDSYSEAYLHEASGAPPKADRDVVVESDFEYGSRVGVWRILDTFERFKVPLTVYAVGLALERNPEAAAAFVEGGHELASHGYRWIDHKPDVDSEASIIFEKKQIIKAVEAIQRFSGKPPAGWYFGRSTFACQALLAQVYQSHGWELKYCSDTYCDDLPYYEEYPSGSSGEMLLKIPYSLDTNDFRYHLPSGWSSPNDFYEYLKDAFDTLYAEGGSGKAGMMSIGLHCRISGKAGRIQALARFLEYIKGKNIWVTTREQIADHWRTHFPAGAS